MGHPAKRVGATGSAVTNVYRKRLYPVKRPASTSTHWPPPGNNALPHFPRSVAIVSTFLLTLCNQISIAMPREISHLHIKISPRLKQDFKAMCDENEIDMSDKVREMIANLVRNHKRQSTKVDRVQV